MLMFPTHIIFDIDGSTMEKQCDNHRQMALLTCFHECCESSLQTTTSKTMKTNNTSKGRTKTMVHNTSIVRLEYG